MPLIVLSALLFVGCAIYTALFVRGLTTGRASTRYHREIDRAREPGLFWAAQGFNAIFAIACLVGGIIPWTGI